MTGKGGHNTRQEVTAQGQETVKCHWKKRRRARDNVSSRTLAESRHHLGWVTSGFCKQLKAVKGWVLGLREVVITTQVGRGEESAKDIQITAG